MIHLDLSTVVPGAPSWKPFPVLITAPLALAGGLAPTLWLLLARAGALVSLALAVRFAGRLAGPWAAVLTVVGLVLSTSWVRQVAHGYTEPLAIGLVVLALEQHLAGRSRRALLLGGLVALVRPEALALVSVYGVLKWRQREVGLPFVAGVAASVFALWIVPDWLGSGDPLHASRVASAVVPSGPAATLEALAQAASIVLWPLVLGAVAGLVFALRRAHDGVVALGATAGAWTALLILLMLLGYPADPRFFALPAALWCILGAVGATSAVQAATSEQLRLALAVTLAVVVLPFAALRVHGSADETADAIDRAQLEAQLRTVVERAGVDASRCREPMLPVSLAWMKGAIAWQLGLPLRAVSAVRTSDTAYLKGLSDPDDEAFPHYATSRAITVHSSREGRTLLAPFAATPVRVVPREGSRVETVARSGPWRAIVLAPGVSCGGVENPHPARRATGVGAT